MTGQSNTEDSGPPKVLQRIFENNSWQQSLAISKGLLHLYMLMTFKEVETKYGHKVNTLYSWLYRGQLEKNGFRHVRVGTVNLLKKINGRGNRNLLSNKK